MHRPLLGVGLGLAWLLLLGLLVGWFEQTQRTCQLACLVILGLLPVLVLALVGQRPPTRTTPAVTALVGLAGAVGVAYLGTPAAAPTPTTSSPVKELGPYVPTPPEVVERMLRVAAVTAEDVVYDLGCGDGRIVITAAQHYGARGVGIDIDAACIRQARANAVQAGVQDRTEFRQADALQVADIDQATVVTLYVLPDALAKLKPLLQARLRPGARIVAHDYDFDDWEPELLTQWIAPDKRRHLIFLWKIPEADS